MTYNDTLLWMYAQLPMFQRQGASAFKKDLTNTLLFVKHLQQPQLHFKSIHVAGTNGKGSTSHMLASILQESGYKVGLYTSPHLRDFRERIKINGALVSEAFVTNFIAANKLFLEQHALSFFEMTVGMAFQHFAENHVDIAVIEVGLGGRLDSTNIILPEVSVITNIGLDHTQFLGNTLPEIASEKAGIIKPHVPVVIGETQTATQDVFKTMALNNNAPIYFADAQNFKQYNSDLKGIYQEKNKKTVRQAVHILQEKKYKITEAHIVNGFNKVVKNTGLLGRWQVLQNAPKVVCDTGHNAEGLSYVFQQIKAETYTKLHIVFGVVQDKDLSSIFGLMPTQATYYFCKPNLPRGLEVDVLLKKFLEKGFTGKAYASVNQAYQAALQAANTNDFIFIGGSTFVVAEII